jgi:hypothetical protein
MKMLPKRNFLSKNRWRTPDYKIQNTSDPIHIPDIFFDPSVHLTSKPQSKYFYTFHTASCLKNHIIFSLEMESVCGNEKPNGGGRSASSLGPTGWEVRSEAESGRRL